MAITRTVNAYSNNTTSKTAIATEQVTSLTALGSTPSTISTVTCQEYSTGKDVVTILTLTDFVIGALAGAGAALGMGNILYTFPAGQHFELVYGFSSLSLTAAASAINLAAGQGAGTPCCVLCACADAAAI